MSHDELTEVWQPHTLGEALQQCLRLRADELALITEKSTRNWQQISERAQSYAKALMAHGIGHGDLVGVMGPNDERWVDVFFGAALIGAITVPVNTRFKSDELAYCLKRADVKLFFTADRFLNIDFIAMLRSAEPAVDSALPGLALPRLQTCVVWGEERPSTALSEQTFLDRGMNISATQLQAARQAVKPDDVLLIQFTSGTTAFPKGVMLTHENMLHNAAAVSKRIGLTSSDRYFNCRPFFHVAGSTLSLLAVLETQSCLVTQPTFEAGTALAMLARERCTFISGNDTLFQLLMNHPTFDRSQLCLRGGWAAAGPETMRRIVEDMGIQGICWSYGQSEASPNVVKSDYRAPVADRIDGLAKPLPGVEVKVVTPGGTQALPANTAGEIHVRGWNVMRGYYSQPELTAQTLDAQGWLHTGDLGMMTPQGHLRFIGRLKDILRVGGENVAPAEIEEALLKHPSVANAQVIGVPDARLSEVPAAYVTLKQSGAITGQDLIAWMQSRIANFKVPRHIAIVDNFENLGMTASGKVQKTKLREDAVKRFAKP